ncbi:diacylglycerol/polyprenol kinase family protein [Cyanobium sp. NS01]|uniref:diacylglycerol/polyprenol kinase family protein n=1 Tax=Cyanobium sp. NS01 TaxID=261284 RepID=UPI001649374C|nr:dolichol kinase [Cyanobium sp. NS01]QNI72068.1 phytol kinase [Cyanobium sp. NS01]
MQGWQQQLVGVLAVLSWLAVLAAGATLLRRRWGQEAGEAPREWSRKLVHIGTGAVVPIAWGLGIAREIAVPAAALVTLLAALNHRLRLLPAVEDVGRRSYGTVAYGASIALLLWCCWPQQPATVAAGVLVMAVGDGLAGLIGPLRPSPSWQVLGQRRSLLGTAVMALASAVVLILLASVATGPSPLWVLPIALAATALEQVGVAGIDNLTVPLGVAWLWQALGPS